MMENKKEEILDELKEKVEQETKIENQEEAPNVEDCGCDCGDECSCGEKSQDGQEIEKLKNELEDWKQSYMRKQADFQNFSKRKEKEMEELRKYSSEKIITKFLGSLDNLERAIEASSETKDFDALVKGVEMILKSLKEIIASEGVEEIKAEGVYDPQYHHAVGVEEVEDKKENEIVKVLQKGYQMKGKVIRPSMVTVAKGK